MGLGKRRNIAEIEDYPPRSRTVIHDTLNDCILDILQKIKALEKEYFAPYSDACQEIKQWVPSLVDVIRAFRLREISSSQTVDDIFVQVETPGVFITAEPEDLEKVREVTKKVKLFVPNKFEDCLNLIDRVFDNLQKYCVSHYDLVNDPPYETGQHYTLCTMQWVEYMKGLLDSVRRLAMRFTVDSISHRDLCPAAQKLIAKTESHRFPFLALFTHVSYSLKEVCDTLKAWVDMDTNYSDFLAYDMKDLEKQRITLSRKTRESQERHFQAQHRIKGIDSEIGKNEAEDKLLKSKADSLIVEEEMLIRTISETKVDIDLKKFEKEDLIRNIGQIDDRELREKFQKIRDENRILKERLPHLEKRMVFVKEKLDWIDTKRDDLEKVKNEFNIEKSTLLYTGDEKTQLEAELEKLTVLLEHVKLIYLFKTSPDVLVKIYYGVPFEVKSPHMKAATEKQDSNVLDRACIVVAEEINKDWPLLYHQLPFSPPRGRINTEADIQIITESFPRDSHADQALKALNRWRRFHTRASLRDLKTTLDLMHRPDVNHVVEYTINPPKIGKEIKEGPVPTFLEPHLIPCYRAIERYDQIHASHG